LVTGADTPAPSRSIGGTGAGYFAAPSVATGLASLRAELPAVRGEAFYFTTPRGEVDITARAVANDSVAWLEHLGTVLAVLIVGLVIYRWGRRWRFEALLRPTLPTLVIVLGLASIVTGVLPVAGLLATIVGVVTWVVLARRQRGKPSEGVAAAR
jgi:hypothetical protein